MKNKMFFNPMIRAVRLFAFVIFTSFGLVGCYETPEIDLPTINKMEMSIMFADQKESFDCKCSQLSDETREKIVQIIEKYKDDFGVSCVDYAPKIMFDGTDKKGNSINVNLGPGYMVINYLQTQGVLKNAALKDLYERIYREGEKIRP